MIPREFFVTSGKASSSTSELNAFDLALKNARIAQCNLVPVTSILPRGCVQKEWIGIPYGAITYAVIARMDGSGGQDVGAAIAWSWEKEERCGIVAEAHGHMDENTLLEVTRRRIREMAKIREIEIGKVNCKLETMRVPARSYGCVLAALVFRPL